MEADIKYKFNFEERKYNEDATQEEIQAIENNVFMYDKDIVYLKEIPIVSCFTINLVFDKMEKLGAQAGKHGIIIDISETRRPDSETRRLINSRFAKICESVEHVSFCTKQNFILNTVARFIMYQTNLDSYSIHQTVLASVQAIKEKIND